MTDEEHDESGQVDRRAFLRGAGRNSIARATTGGLRGGLLGWAIARAEASAQPVEPDDYLEDEDTEDEIEPDQPEQ